MSTGNTPRPRARQACEPCRRKKTKCPGERPVCSVCNRLRQTCTYAAYSDEFRIHRPSSTESSVIQHPFIQSLASRVESIEDVLNVLRQTQSQTSGTTRSRGRVTAAANIATSSPVSPNTPASVDTAHFHPLERTTPPKSTIDSLVEMYRTKLDTFGICVVDTDVLSSNLERCSKLFLWAFLSLTVPFSEDTFFTGVQASAGAYYANTAREHILRDLHNFTGSLELLQSACFLCYGEILDGRPMAALMTLGIVIRYVMCANLLSSHSKDVSRCLWTLFTFDRAYGSSLNVTYAFPQDVLLPEMPSELARPRSPTTIADSMREGTGHEVSDEGIVAGTFKLLSSWSAVFSYLKKVKFGLCEDAWRSGSVHQQIASELLEMEIVFPQRYRLQFLRFDQQDIAEIANSKQFWTSWIVSQVLYHATRAMHSHPIIHFTQKGSSQAMRPPSFLQHIADQAILHSQWVVRLLQLCSEKGFPVEEPLVVYLTAATATVHFFLCFAKDELLATKSAENFASCHQYVQAASKTWRHVGNMAHVLAELAHIIEEHRRDRSSRMPKVNEASIWILLDHAASTNVVNPQRVAGEVVEVDVRTQYLSPLNPDDVQPSQAPDPGAVPFNLHYLWANSHQTPDMLEIPQMPGFTLPDDFWMDSQV